MRSSLIIAMVSIGTAHADPATSTALPQPPFLSLQPMPMFSDPAPIPTVASLRLDAARAAAEVFENSWRYPDASPLFTIVGGSWFVGGGRYTPRSGRAGSLHTGSVVATFVGELLIASGSPLAGVGAMVTGVTLDAAAADADRDAEAARKR